MTTKERVLAMLERQHNGITYDELIYKLEVMKSVEQGIRDADEGRLMDHDEFMAELEAEDEALKAEMGAKSKKRTARNPGVYRRNGAPARSKVRSKAQSSGKKF
jgi:hypothetical protein